MLRDKLNAKIFKGNSKDSGKWMAIGAGLGVALGASTGIALGNLPIGVGAGVAIGTAIGMLFEQKSKTK